MLASLGAGILAYLRALGTGVPLQTGVKIDSLNRLSLPAIIARVWKGKRERQTEFVAIILVCTLLGVSVRISSTTLIRPCLNGWPAGGAPFWINATNDVLSPQIVQDLSSLEHCAFDTGGAAWPYGKWRLIQQQYHAFWPRVVPMGSMPVNKEIPSLYLLRAMRVSMVFHKLASRFLHQRFRLRPQSRGTSNGNGFQHDCIRHRLRL